MTQKLDLSWVEEFQETLIPAKQYKTLFNKYNSVKIIDVLATGTFATCFITNANFIVKTNNVTNGIDIDRIYDGQVAWLEYSMKNFSPFTPKVHYLSINGNYYTTAMERLNPLPVKYINFFVSDIIKCLNNKDTNTYNIIDTNIPCKVDANPLYTTLKSCYTLLHEKIHALTNEEKSLKPDVNKSNICYRGDIKNLVILDPFWKTYASN